MPRNSFWLLAFGQSLAMVADRTTLILLVHIFADRLSHSEYVSVQFSIIPFVPSLAVPVLLSFLLRKSSAKKWLLASIFFRFVAFTMLASTAMLGQWNAFILIIIALSIGISSATLHTCKRVVLRILFENEELKRRNSILMLFEVLATAFAVIAAYLFSTGTELQFSVAAIALTLIAGALFSGMTDDVISSVRPGQFNFQVTTNARRSIVRGTVPFFVAAGIFYACIQFTAAIVSSSSAQVQSVALGTMGIGAILFGVMDGFWGPNLRRCNSPHQLKTLACVCILISGLAMVLDTRALAVAVLVPLGYAVGGLFSRIQASVQASSTDHNVGRIVGINESVGAFSLLMSAALCASVIQKTGVSIPLLACALIILSISLPSNPSKEVFKS